MNGFIGGLFVAIIGWALGFACGWSSRGELDAQSLAVGVELGDVRFTKRGADQ